jgi:hypothetical protein
MVRPNQSVKANWAALVGGSKVHWIDRKRIEFDGMKSHVKIQSTLPCGWTNHIVIHKQASLKEMNPEQPFYLLDDGTQLVSPLFYPMLNKCLALPLLENWSEYLWKSGRERNLITLLNEGEGQGYAAWRALPAPQEWQDLIQDGLLEGSYVFDQRIRDLNCECWRYKPIPYLFTTPCYGDPQISDLLVVEEELQLFIHRFCR